MIDGKSIQYNLNTSACLNFNHGTTKKVASNMKGAEVMGFIKTFDQYP